MVTFYNQAWAKKYFILLYDWDQEKEEELIYLRNLEKKLKKEKAALLNDKEEKALVAGKLEETISND